MALAMPLTLAWEPVPVMLLYGAFVGGATFMGSITAILFNVPGRAPSAATMLDGHPMARMARPARRSAVPPPHRRWARRSACWYWSPCYRWCVG